jgi:hypothetical protein
VAKRTCAGFVRYKYEEDDIFYSAEGSIFFFFCLTNPAQLRHYNLVYLVQYMVRGAEPGGGGGQVRLAGESLAPPLPTTMVRTVVPGTLKSYT